MEDETLCEECNEPVESSELYETADGKYVCIHCYTKGPDTAEDVQ